MKCLPFIITLYLGRFIDVQGENNADFGGSDGPLLSKISEEKPPEETDNEADENPLVAETENPPEELEQSSNDDKFDISDSTEAESSEQEIHWNTKENKQDILKPTENSTDEETYKHNEETVRLYLAELNAGDTADLIGQNQHIEQSNLYLDLGRRSEAQALKNIAAENVDYLTPEKAPPELVLLVAKESALLRAGKDTDLGSDFDRKKILRSGDYWNGVWKEEVNPKTAMRSSSQKKKLGSIKAKINPGTELYKVVTRMKKISPQLLYIINKKQPSKY